ncbi:phage tail tape measure protein, partial [Salmonella enterica subsp. enterica serovar Minnesota]
NPELTKALLTVGGSALALTAISGGLSLAVGLLLGPVAKLRLGFELLTGTRGLGRAIPLFTQLRAVWGVITGALSLLLSPVGLIGAAFVAAGVLIWRYWEPIKAFFTGFFSWVWEALTPLRY